MSIKYATVKSIEELIELTFKDDDCNKEEFKLLNNTIIESEKKFDYIIDKNAGDFLKEIMDRLGNYLDKIGVTQSKEEIKQFDIYRVIKSKEDLEKHWQEMRYFYRKFQEALLEFLEIK